MPYTTNVAGTTITASYANANIRDQVVTPFASTSARDSAITSPVVGMVVYISSNDSSEGLWTYTNAGVWRRPWSMPWGYVTSNTKTTTQNATGSFANVVTTSATYTANRRIQIVATWRGLQAATATDNCELRIYKDSATQLQSQAIAFASSAEDQEGGTLIAFDTPTAAVHTYNLQIMRTSGSGTITLAGDSDNPITVYITDVGPSSGPA